MILGVAGGSGSGKTRFARLVQETLGEERCCLLQQDAYYHDQSRRFDRDGGSVNFDHPDAVDLALLADHLRELRAGRSVAVPVYDYSTHSRSTTTEVAAGRPVILVEGMLVLASEAVRQHLDLGIFIEAAEQVRLERRVRRDTRERGRHRAGVERQFAEHVRPMHQRFVEPSRVFADHVFSGEGAMEDRVGQLLRELHLAA
jgi:uridine kinase